MVWHRYNRFMRKAKEHPRWDETSAPGAKAGYAGIYRCLGCSREIAIQEGQSLPDAAAHPHGEKDGNIEWLLVVRAEA